jgi:hypothetical protein
MESIMCKPISPVIVTLLFAAAAAALVASAAALPYPAPRVARVNAALCLALAGYAVYLARLHRRPISVLFGPLLVAAAAALAAGSVSAFALPATTALSWIRWGIGGRPPRALRVALEVVAGAGGLVLAEMIGRLAPGPQAWAVGAWGFGLAQAVAVACVDVAAAAPGPPAPSDRFARTHQRADALLREEKLEKAFEELGL